MKRTIIALRLALVAVGYLFFVAIAYADAIYVSNQGQSSAGILGSISKYDSNGNQLVFNSSITSPGGLTFDPGGSLYVGVNNAIEKFDTNGNMSVFANSGLSAPQGLAFDSSGNLYVTEIFGGDQIERFTSG